MQMSRREFLATTAAAALPLPPVTVPERTHTRPRGVPNWRLVALSDECSIIESRLGYGRTLPFIRTIAGPPSMRQRRDYKLIILPAVLNIASDLAWTLGAYLRNGSTVIIESGGAFAGHLQFRRHRQALREGLQLDISAPVELWPPEAKRRQTPYVDYNWPYATKIRDFSRVVPIGDGPGKIIAWADGLPVGLKRRVGTGTLIYLGSPMGPALWAEDAQARRWLLTVWAWSRS